MATAGPSTDKSPKVADFDELVDEVLAKKGPAKYTDGLSEENWEDELEKIPLFMTTPPSEIDAASAPAVAALQDLIYKEDTPHSRAVAYKEDGNEHFKKKRYKEAVDAYSKGLLQNCEDYELKAVLFCNRGTAQYRRGNHRAALIDADEAHRADPDYMKAIVRGAEACMQLKRYTEAIQWCDDGLRREEQHSRLKELRVQVTKEKKKRERDNRKERAALKLKTKQDLELIQIIKSRGVTLDGEETDGEGIELTGPHPAGVRVHLAPDGVLVWPVLLLYPEFNQSDYIVNFREHDRFIDHLEVMFKEPAPWDVDKQYPVQALQLYHEDVFTLAVWRVDLEDTLGSVLRRKSLIVRSGTPAFFVLSALTPFMTFFLKRK